MRQPVVIHCLLLPVLLCVVVGSVRAQQPQPPVDAPVALTPGEVLQRVEDQAVREVLNASRSDDAQLRANAIEAMGSRPRRLVPLAQIGMDDPNPAVRFAALIAVGNLKAVSLGPAVTSRLKDEDPSVRAAAMYAANACGLQVNMNELPRMLNSTVPQVRGNAVMVLGMMGDASAVPMLRERAKNPMVRAEAINRSLINLQIAEAMVKLGEDSEIDPIRAAVWSQDDEVRVLAVLMLGRLNDRSQIRALQGLLVDQPVELRLAAAQALAQMGVHDGLATMLEAAAMDASAVEAQARQFIRDHPRSPYAVQYQQLLRDPQQQAMLASQARSQSAFGLSYVRNVAAAEALARLIDDPVVEVRLSAAAGVLRALTPEPGRG